jgi:alkaline phosphatase
VLWRVTPLIRSFISIPAGVLGGSPFVPYAVLTLLGSAVWCFGLAGAGWAIGGSWHDVHDALRFVDYAVVAAVAGLVIIFAVRQRQAAKLRA